MRHTLLSISMTLLFCGAVLAGCSKENNPDGPDVPAGPELPAPAIGDYFYSDGTWSGDLDTGKEIVGVVFYTGDITAVDPILAKEHPECTHGLAVSLTEISENTSWQSGYTQYGATVDAWISQNLEGYISILADTSSAGTNLNTPLGYNNTRAIEAFNADPANSSWPVEAVQSIVTFREANSVPDNTSGWYLPSAKEMSLLITGEYDGNIWMIRDPNAKPTNMLAVNERLATIPDAEQIGANSLLGLVFYWSSTEMTKDMAITAVPVNGQVPSADKTMGYPLSIIRPIFAF